LSSSEEGWAYVSEPTNNASSVRYFIRVPLYINIRKNPYVTKSLRDY